jgi:hypothetical protein
MAVLVMAVLVMAVLVTEFLGPDIAPEVYIGAIFSPLLVTFPWEYEILLPADEEGGSKYSPIIRSACRGFRGHPRLRMRCCG